jgi:hypothetical protein
MNKPFCKQQGICDPSGRILSFEYEPAAIFNTASEELNNRSHMVFTGDNQDYRDTCREKLPIGFRIIGSFPTGNRCLFVTFVRGKSRVLFHPQE